MTKGANKASVDLLIKVYILDRSSKLFLIVLRVSPQYSMRILLTSALVASAAALDSAADLSGGDDGGDDGGVDALLYSGVDGEYSGDEAGDDSAEPTKGVSLTGEHPS